MSSMFKTLDVGCGNDPQGDVNVDLYMNQRSPDTDVYINAKKINNPIKADAQNLPFRYESFEIVYCRALLEHVLNPTRALKEMIRVAKEKVLFIVPHRCFRTSWVHGQPKVHKHFFSTVETRKWVERIGYKPKITVEYKSFPSEIIPIFRLPWLLHVEIKKVSRYYVSNKIA